MGAVKLRSDQYIDGDPELVASLSLSAQRLLLRPRPRWRGVLHRWAAIASVPIGIVMVVLAEGRSGTFGMAFYCVGMTSMLTASAVVHLRDWKPSQVELLVRLDHSAIFVMFAMAGTPLAWLGMQGRPGTWLLIVLWAGSAIGIAAEWIPIHPPAGFMNAAYLTFGWGTAIFLPWMIRDLDLALLVLLLAGGAAYTSGAIVVGARRPDPWPRTFGYHEVWHVAVLIACVLHLALVARLTGAI